MEDTSALELDEFEGAVTLMIFQTCQTETPEKFSSVLSDHQSDIINYLGGLDNIVELCLSNNDYVKSHINGDNLSNLETLFTRKNENNHDSNPSTQVAVEMDNESENESKNSMGTNTNTTANATAAAMDKTTAMDKTAAKLRKQKSDLDLAKNQLHAIIAPTNYVAASEYNFNRSIIKIDAHNNVYFRKFSNDVAAYIFYRLLVNKCFVILTAAFGFGCILIGLIYSIFTEQYDPFYYGFTLTGYYTVLLLALCYLMSANIDMIFLILQSFEFWYKSYSMIIYTIAGCAYDFQPFTGWDGGYVGDALLYLSNLGIVFVFFMIDAIYIPNKLKIIFCILASSFSFFFGCVIYLTYEDLYWVNPPLSTLFGIEVTSINIKTLYVGSLINLSLFLAKPVFGAVLFYYKFNYKSYVEKRGLLYDKQNEKYLTSITIQQRPYLLWQNARVGNTPVMTLGQLTNNWSQAD